MDKPNIFVRFFRFIWRLFGVLRALVQILLVLLIVGLIVTAFRGAVVKVPDTAALVIAPSGQLVDQLADDPFVRALADAQGIPPRETLTRDVVDALQVAAEDERIEAVVLSLGELEGGGLTKLREIGEAIVAFRESGKPVIAMGDAYSQAQYYLAAHADTVFLHEFGAVYLDGFGYFRAYFREALEKLRIDMNVFRVGEYKSFVEPFTRDDMSAADKEAASRWLEALWAAYRDDVAQARGLDAGALNAYANELADRVDAADGNLATVAMESGLVTGLTGRLEFDNYMVELVGEADNGYTGFSSIGHADYLRSVRVGKAARKEANVGVIVASGQIVDGKGPPGTVGGDTLAALVRKAAADDAVDAVVLRVDSPGGSRFASEVVFEALNGLKDTGKPLVASMSSVAASGGYYIAMPADEIWADGATITGSIGVGALLPTFQRSLAELGVRTDGFGTTTLSGQAEAARDLGPDARRILQSSVEEAYRQFVQRVAASRDMSYERADGLARGRVWVGDDALELGLVDVLGGLDGAITVAAERAGIDEEDFGIRYIQEEMGFQERLSVGMVSAGQAVLEWADVRRVGSAGGNSLARIVERIDAELHALAHFNDPRNLYYHCFCGML